MVNEVILAYLHKGEYFGDTAILQKRLRTATIETATYCDLHVLTAKHLEKLLKAFPADTKLILANCGNITKESRLTFQVRNESENVLGASRTGSRTGSAVSDGAGKKGSPRGRFQKVPSGRAVGSVLQKQLSRQADVKRGHAPDG